MGIRKIEGLTRRVVNKLFVGLSVEYEISNVVVDLRSPFYLDESVRCRYVGLEDSPFYKVEISMPLPYGEKIIYEEIDFFLRNSGSEAVQGWGDCSDLIEFYHRGVLVLRGMIKIKAFSLHHEPFQMSLVNLQGVNLALKKRGGAITGAKQVFSNLKLWQ